MMALTLRELLNSMELPNIPHSWLIALLLVCLVVLRAYGIDSFTTASISMIIGYLTGVKLEQARKNP